MGQDRDAIFRLGHHLREDGGHVQTLTALALPMSVGNGSHDVRAFGAALILAAPPRPVAEQAERFRELALAPLALLPLRAGHLAKPIRDDHLGIPAPL